MGLNDQEQLNWNLIKNKLKIKLIENSTKV